MAKRAPAPYFFSLLPFLEREDHLLRETKGGLLFEVHRSISIQTAPNQWWQADPGQVVHPIWRPVTPLEILWWEATNSLKSVAESFRKIDDGPLEVRTVEVVDDLPGILRQHTRHIPASLVGRRIGAIELPGDFDLTGNQIQKLSDLLGEIAKKRKLTPRDIEGFNREMAQIHEQLLRTRSAPKANAREEIATRLKERPDLGLPTDVIELLLGQQRKDVRIALAVLGEAREIIRIYRQIHQGIAGAWKQLGKQLQRLKGNPSPRTIASVAQQMTNTFAYMDKVATFNPFYERVHSEEVVRLQKARHFPDHPDVLQRYLRDAIEKLSVLVEGEVPTAQEIAAAKSRLK